MGSGNTALHRSIMGSGNTASRRSIMWGQVIRPDVGL